MIYTCEIINENVPYNWFNRPRSNFPYEFLAKITSINYGRQLPTEFETVIVFDVTACKDYDKDKPSYPIYWTIPLKMICVNDYIEFEGTPYKDGKAINPNYPDNADWITIDTTSHIERLPPDLQSAKKLVREFQAINRKKTKAKCNAVLNWPYKIIKKGFRWINSQSTTIITGVIYTILAMGILYLARYLFNIYFNK